MDGRSAMAIAAIAAGVPAIAVPARAQTTRISAIQGRGGQVTGRGPFTVEGIVTGDFQGASQLRGFFVQEEDADADGDANTSEGIFVFCSDCPVDVTVGDEVRVIGTATEFGGMSQLSATRGSAVRVLGQGRPLPTPIAIDLPVAEDEVDGFFEGVEGMLVRFEDRLSIDEVFQLGRFGQVLLSEGPRLRQYTDIAQQPSPDGYRRHLEERRRRVIVLDDDAEGNNVALAEGLPVFHPVPGFSTDNLLRAGDTIEGLTGVLHWSRPAPGSPEGWRVRPVVEAFPVAFRRDNPRTESPPPVGGHLKVASFNVLNFFVTLDDGTPRCGPTADEDCRGANTEVELERQTRKLAAAICAIDADILGVVELQNDPRASLVALTTGVAAAGCPPYRFVDAGQVGDDVIKVGLLYREAAARLQGQPVILDAPSFIDAADTDEPRNRAALAATFQHLETGSRLTVVVNHLKSTGRPCGPGDDSPEDGQGNCNRTRTLGAQALASWLQTGPIAAATPNVLILGDLNAYRNEAPIRALKSSGFVDLLDRFVGPDAYTFVFDGAIGYLDHALASPDLLPFITGAATWAINADEANLLSYDDPVRDPGERPFEAKPSARPLFEPGPYRSSDHDPVIVGIDFGSTADRLDAGMGTTPPEPETTGLPDWSWPIAAVVAAMVGGMSLVFRALRRR